MTNWEAEKHNRPFFKALLFERDGDLNLTWLFVFIMGIFGAVGFIYTIVAHGMTVWDRIAAWSFMGAAFASVLIAALPIAKAKILANAKLPGEIAHSIGSVADHAVETSTDISEIKRKHVNNEIG